MLKSVFHFVDRSMTQRRFVVLDRDGTIIVEHHYLSNPDRVELIPEAVSGLRQLREMELGLIIITNQSAIGHGFFDQACLDLIHKRLHELLNAEGVQLDSIYICPHTPEENCLCRKPETGLLELAAQEFGFDPQSSFVIGDKACDVEMGRRVGATTFLVRTGYGAQVVVTTSVSPDYVVDDVAGAAQVIRRLLATDKREGYINKY